MEPKDFGWCLRMLFFGKKMCREGWNGRGMWIALYRPLSGDSEGMTLPFIYIEYETGHPKYPDGCKVPWLASQTDMLADDWEEYTGV